MALTRFTNWVNSRFELNWSPNALPSGDPAELRRPASRLRAEEPVAQRALVAVVAPAARTDVILLPLALNDVGQPRREPLSLLIKALEHLPQCQNSRSGAVGDGDGGDDDSAAHLLLRGGLLELGRMHHIRIVLEALQLEAHTLVLLWRQQRPWLAAQ